MLYFFNLHWLHFTSLHWLFHKIFEQKHTWTKNISLFLEIKSAKFSFSTWRSKTEEMISNWKAVLHTYSIKLLKSLNYVSYSKLSMMLYIYVLQVYFCILFLLPTSCDCQSKLWIILYSDDSIFFLFLFFFNKFIFTIICYFSHCCCFCVDTWCVGSFFMHF